MCGEHFLHAIVSNYEQGSSPHVRGTLPPIVVPVRRGGIIPACAGNTGSQARLGLIRRDHPRMCGEHSRVILLFNGTGGSSPHVRGTRSRTRQCVSGNGIIPACAGNTSRRPVPATGNRDHPRMCGEHWGNSLFTVILEGSSPHVRGTQYGENSATPQNGIIPACAGNTISISFMYWLILDHPRMCGEHRTILTCEPVCSGSSPHVRGTRRGHGQGPYRPGIIPACAGNTWRIRHTPAPTRDHPRMCGEHRKSRQAIAVPTGSSPHVRGTLGEVCARQCVGGIIPACAGNTPTPDPTGNCSWDHPRMCGEHVPSIMTGFRTPGSSPHVRGTRSPWARANTPGGIIPACAWNTRLVSMTAPPMGDHPRMCGEHREEQPVRW